MIICLTIGAFSLLDRFTTLHITLGWIVEPLGFAYGIVLSNHHKQIKRWLQIRWMSKCIGLALLSGVFGIVYLKFKPIVFFGDYLLKIFLGIAILAFILEVITKVKMGNRINSFLGEISYEIYILHRSTFLLIEILFTKVQSGVFIVTSIVMSIFLAVGLKMVCRPMVRKIAYGGK